MKMQENLLNSNTFSSYISIHSRLKLLRKKRRRNSILIFIIIILLVMIQYIFQDNLYDLSISISNSMNKFYLERKNIIINFQKFSEIKFIMLIMFIIYFEYPITKSYSFLIMIIFSWYISSVTDIFYGKYREWDENDLMKYYTNGSEKPSSHCIMATSIYFALWDILTTDTNFNAKKKKTNKTIIKFFFLFILLLFIILLIFSQVIQKNHSFNMCIVGSLLGLSFYNFLFRYITLHLIEPKKFMKYFRKKSISLMLFFSYIVGLIILFAVYFSFVRKVFFEIPNSKIKNEIILFNNESLENGLCLFILIGVHFGIEYLESFSSKKFPNKEQEINSFNNVSLIKKIFILIVILFYSFSLTLLISIDNQNYPFGIVICLKYGLSYFSLGYSFYGIGLITNIKFEICNTQIYKKRNESMELNELNDDIDNEEEEYEESEFSEKNKEENNDSKNKRIEDELIYIPKY